MIREANLPIQVHTIVLPMGGSRRQRPSPTGRNEIRAVPRSRVTINGMEATMILAGSIVIGVLGGAAVFIAGRKVGRRRGFQDPPTKKRTARDTPSGPHWHCEYSPWYGKGTCTWRHESVEDVWWHTGTPDNVHELVPVQCECPDPRPFEIAAKGQWLDVHKGEQQTSLLS